LIKYFAIISELEALIESKLSTIPNAGLSQVSCHIRDGTPATQGNSVSNHLKLPRINLPTFAGSFDEWIPFRNMFQSMIDQNAALPDTQKMQYLISSLKGEARDVIGSLEVSNENYAEIWGMLRERYDDSTLIIQKHIRALFKMPAIAKENHLLLRRLLDNILKHLRALKAFEKAQWDDLMIHLLMSRLDQKTNRAWKSTLKRGEMPTLKQLTDFLAQHCKALEASVRTVRIRSSVLNQEKIGQNKGISANLTTTSNKCAYCGKEDHAIYNCGDYLQLEE